MGFLPVPLWPEAGEWTDEASRAAYHRQNTAETNGEPEDIARTVAFLIADAPYITGQIIAVDGGVVLICNEGAVVC